MLDGVKRLALLRENGPAYLSACLTNAEREYPVVPIYVATGPGPYPSHRAHHPAFYGCFDWHSSVNMHWAAVRLLRLFPELPEQDAARAALSSRLTPENLAVETEFYQRKEHRGIERPYGWGWLLKLQHELLTWNDRDAQAWAGAIQPLASHLAESLIEWLPKLSYAVRTGIHSNTAFALSLAYDYAELRAENGASELLTAINGRALYWFHEDRDWPAHYEPSGIDFLSPGLCEAELLSRILPPEEFPKWLGGFLPGLADEKPQSLFHPAGVTDPSDGHIAHLHGLNLSRAWAFTRIADRLPIRDPRSERMLLAAERHAEVSLPFVVGSDYMLEHWMASYATLLLSW